MLSSTSDVSIHAPAWGAINDNRRVLFVSMVSIHAPAWGAIEMMEHAAAAKRVSIHAPAWGAIHHRCTPRTGRVGFNSRTRVGCDKRR